jgi:hypothetical protein
VSTTGNGHHYLHDVPHSYTTAGRDAKIDGKALSQRVGHADVGFTMKQYVQADLEGDWQVAITLAELIIGDLLSLVAIEDGDATDRPMRPDHDQGGTKIPFTNPFTGCMQKAPSMIGRGL